MHAYTLKYDIPDTLKKMTQQLTTISFDLPFVLWHFFIPIGLSLLGLGIGAGLGYLILWANEVVFKLVPMEKITITEIYRVMMVMAIVGFIAVNWMCLVWIGWKSIIAPILAMTLFLVKNI